MSNTHEQRMKSRPRADDALVLFAKAPIPGQVKTRLCPPLTGDEAASLHGSFVLDALERSGQAAIRRAARPRPIVRRGPRQSRQRGGNRATRKAQAGCAATDSAALPVDQPRVQTTHRRRWVLKIKMGSVSSEHSLRFQPAKAIRQ